MIQDMINSESSIKWGNLSTCHSGQFMSFKYIYIYITKKSSLASAVSFCNQGPCLKKLTLYKWWALLGNVGVPFLRRMCISRQSHLYSQKKMWIRGELHPQHSQQGKRQKKKLESFSVEGGVNP